MAPYYEIEIDSHHISLDEDVVALVEIDNNYEYSDFFTKYLYCNKPVLIRGVANNWESFQNWSIDNNLNFMVEKYGDSEVMIYDCKTPHYNSQKAECSTFSQYVQLWEKAKEDSLYLKDWHLQNQFKDDKFYEVPNFFASDWLNEYLVDTSDDDYRFVYVGPSGTWTPFHADVFMSYSWSTNICGQKKWLIFPPGEETQLKDYLGNLPYDISETTLDNCRHFEVIQNKSDAIFIPSGWYHQVWNLEDTISINHNWVNGCNIACMWKSLSTSLERVEKEIDGCKDMDDFQEHCQVMLKASFGMDFKDFCKFLHYIARKRINFLCDNIPIILFDVYTLGMRHAVFDLDRVMEVLKLYQKHPACAEAIVDEFSTEQLIKTIQDCIDVYNTNT